MSLRSCRLVDACREGCEDEEYDYRLYNISSCRNCMGWRGSFCTHRVVEGCCAGRKRQSEVAQRPKVKLGLQKRSPGPLMDDASATYAMRDNSARRKGEMNLMIYIARQDDDDDDDDDETVGPQGWVECVE